MHLLGQDLGGEDAGRIAHPDDLDVAVLRLERLLEVADVLDLESRIDLQARALLRRSREAATSSNATATIHVSSARHTIYTALSLLAAGYGRLGSRPFDDDCHRSPRAALGPDRRRLPRLLRRHLERHDARAVPDRDVARPRCQHAAGRQPGVHDGDLVGHRLGGRRLAVGPDRPAGDADRRPVRAWRSPWSRQAYRRQLLLGRGMGDASAGGCAGTFTGVVFAEVSARVEDHQRGRALGWVMSGQSLTLVVGVPLAAWIGSMIGWRGWNVCMAGLALAASARPVRHRRARTGHSGPRGARGHRCARPVARACSALLGDRHRRAHLLWPGDGLLRDLPAGDLRPVAGRHRRCRSRSSRSAISPAPILGGQLADRLRDRLLTFARRHGAVGRRRPRPVHVASRRRRSRWRWASSMPAECARPAVLHGGARQRAGRGARHRAGPERRHGQRRLGRRRRAGRR